MSIIDAFATSNYDAGCRSETSRTLNLLLRHSYVKFWRQILVRNTSNIVAFMMSHLRHILMSDADQKQVEHWRFYYVNVTSNSDVKIWSEPHRLLSLLWRQILMSNLSQKHVEYATLLWRHFYVEFWSETHRIVSLLWRHIMMSDVDQKQVEYCRFYDVIFTWHSDVKFWSETRRISALLIRQILTSDVDQKQVV